MTDEYTNLGPFSDLVVSSKIAHGLFPRTRSPQERTEIRSVIQWSVGSEQPHAPQEGRKWRAEGVVGKEVSWSVGYGPRTQALLIISSDRPRPLPGIVALHDHGMFKFYGKEKIADGPDGPAGGINGLRSEFYSGRAFANELARVGFAVLVPDVFLWGSRRLPLETMPVREIALADTLCSNSVEPSLPNDIARYNIAAMLNEGTVEKYCRTLGTTLAAMVSYEDRVAANFLATCPEIDQSRIGCVGLSGGGCRAGMLHATSDAISASVIVGMMSTQEAMLDRHIASHTWMFFPPGLTRVGDWPDLVASTAPKPLLVQYLRDDDLFPEAGMLKANSILKHHYAEAGAPGSYSAEFFSGPHRFDAEMQQSAFRWLAKQFDE